MAITIIVTIALTIAVFFVISAKVVGDINRRGGCPTCRTPLPMLRRPTSFHQSFWGGWTCESCGSELDRTGRLIES